MVLGESLATRMRFQTEFVCLTFEFVMCIVGSVLGLMWCGLKKAPWAPWVNGSLGN